MCCRGWERLAACFDGWLPCQNHLGSAEQPPVLVLYVASPRLPATFTCPGCVSFQAQSSCALPRRWSPCGELGASPPVVPQLTHLPAHRAPRDAEMKAAAVIFYPPCSLEDPVIAGLVLFPSDLSPLLLLCF